MEQTSVLLAITIKKGLHCYKEIANSNNAKVMQVSTILCNFFCVNFCMNIISLNLAYKLIRTYVD